MGNSYSRYPDTSRGDPKSAQLHREETHRNLHELWIKPSRHLPERAKKKASLFSCTKTDKLDKNKTYERPGHVSTRGTSFHRPLCLRDMK